MLKADALFFFRIQKRITNLSLIKTEQAATFS